MKGLFAVGFLLAATHALAHPGHGRPGAIHFHEFSDGLLIGLALTAAVLVVWAWRR